MAKPSVWAALLLTCSSLVSLSGMARAADETTVTDRVLKGDSPMWWFGFQLHGVTDGGIPDLQPDSFEAYDSNQSTYFGWGAGLTLPIGVNLWQGLGFRGALSLSYSGDPFDQAITQIAFLDLEEQGTDQRSYRTMEAFFAGGSLLIDVQYMFPLLFETVKPYLGAGPGLFVNYVFTDLTAEEYELLENEYNEVDNPNNIDPYSVNVAPGFNGYLGVNFKVTGPMHLNFELEYDVAWMREAALLKASDGYDARRASYLYSAVRISSGLLFNF